MTRAFYNESQRMHSITMVIKRLFHRQAFNAIYLIKQVVDNYLDIGQNVILLEGIGQNSYSLRFY